MPPVKKKQSRAAPRAKPRPSPAAVVFGALILLLAGLTWKRQSAFADELTLWLDTLAKNPRAWIAMNGLGTIALDEGDLETALGWFRKCLDVKPDHAKAVNNIGIIYKNQGRVEEAIAQYRKAIALDPAYFDPYYNLCLLYVQQDRIEEAILAFQAAAKVDPANFDVHHDLGIIYEIQGAEDDAIREYRTALAVREDTEIYNRLAGLYLKKGRDGEAADVYRKALRFDPGNQTAAAYLRK